MSDSIWEKSGLIVASTIVSASGSHFASSPTLPLVVVSSSGSPFDPAYVFVLVTAPYGASTQCAPLDRPVIPSIVADWHRKQLEPRGTRTL